MHTHLHNAETAADSGGVSYISSTEIAFEPSGAGHSAFHTTSAEALSEIFCEGIDQLSIAA